jgi:DNA (cytosine-5)-methyltransferase 1
LPSPDLPAAITAEQALEDLPPITHHLRGEMKRGAKNFNTDVTYREDVELSSYARAMRTWPGFETDNVIRDHVTRYLPRDYELFARMRPGDQYPEVYKLAHELFQQSLAQRESATDKKIAEGSQEYNQLKATIVPPYDPGKFPNKWRKIEPNMPARTLTAHIGKDTYSHIHYDSSQARVISVREAARLQSFPDGFVFTGPMNTAFRQIGNAVPPLLSYALAKHIKCLVAQAAERIEALKNVVMNIE